MDTDLTRTVPAVLRLFPKLLIPVHHVVGTAGPLTVTALQLGQSGLCIVQLRQRTKSPESPNKTKISSPLTWWISNRCSKRRKKKLNHHSAQAPNLRLQSIVKWQTGLTTPILPQPFHSYKMINLSPASSFIISILHCCLLTWAMHLWLTEVKRQCHWVRTEREGCNKTFNFRAEFHNLVFCLLTAD